MPDPQAADAFLASKLHWEMREKDNHRILRDFYAEMLRLRRTVPALRDLAKNKLEIASIKDTNALFVVRYADLSRVFAAFHFGDKPVSASLPAPGGSWQKVLDSSDARWVGLGSQISPEANFEGQAALPLLPWSFILFLHS